MDAEFRRATGLLVIEVVNSNPNGDPDRESDPRQRPDGRGEISGVSFKRKLRDLLEDHTSPFFKAATAITTAKKVFPIPAGPTPKMTS